MAYEHGVTRNPIPIRQHNRVFDRVVATPGMRRGTTVAWWLDAREFDVEGPYSFYLEWAEHPDADWLEVAGPTAGNTLFDGEQRRFSKLPHSCYRVRLEASGGLFYSQPNQLLGEWNRHDFLLAKEMIRREYLLLSRYTGTLGRYMARKQWGEICPECSDWDTEMTTDSHCKTCYGTGFVGGYWPASQIWFGEDRVDVRAIREDGIGVQARQQQIVRVAACPYLTAKDIWINPQTDERFSIEKVTEAAAVRGRPLVWQVEIRLIEPSNIVYDLPIVDNSSSSLID